MVYLLQTLPGLGPLAGQEAEQRLSVRGGARRPQAAGTHFVPGRNDLVLLRYDGSTRELLRLRISEDVFAVAVRAFKIAPDERGLRQIFAATRDTRAVGDALAAWSQALNTRRKPTTFRVVTREVGSHQFRRRDIGRAVTDAIKAGWPGRWREVAEDADIEVWATLLKQELVCGVRLSGPEMRHRGRERHMPAALRPALAAAMVWLTDPAPQDVFLDPLAGTGTLLLERAAAGPFAHLYGSDHTGEAVKNLRINTRQIGGEVTCERWDARSLPLPAESVNKVATNMPFGKQVALEQDLPTLYRGVLAEIGRVLRPGGCLVTLVGDAGLLETARTAAAPELRPGTSRRVSVLGTAASINVFQKQ
jgi:23S rRNA G2445 N2-methylase RlmL